MDDSRPSSQEQQGWRIEGDVCKEKGLAVCQVLWKMCLLFVWKTTELSQQSGNRLVSEVRPISIKKGNCDTHSEPSVSDHGSSIAEARVKAAIAADSQPCLYRRSESEERTFDQFAIASFAHRYNFDISTPKCQSWRNSLTNGSDPVEGNPQKER